MDAIEYFKGMRKRLCEDYLKLLPKKSVGYQTTLREMSFYDAAIKALDQAPCIDAISRSEAIRVASGYCHFTNIPDELAKLPSVNPKPCEDAISRRLLKYLGAECIAKRDENDNLIPLGSVDSLPSVSTEKTGRWIPVSERLPELLEDVLICDSGGNINIGFCCKRKYANGKEYTSWVEIGSDWDATPIAWMPLPQPYEPQESEE